MAVSGFEIATICARMAELRNGIRLEGVLHLHRNQIGTPVNIRRGEAEQPKTGADKPILATVVINQSITMIPAVVFDCQPRKAVKQVWAA